MSYRFSSDTLIHSCGFNLYSFYNILKNGIMSYSYAKENGFVVDRNYYGSNLDDMISCVRYLYVNDSIEDGAYSAHVKNGLSFILEDVSFVYDKGDRFIHRYDEVLVKDYIDVSRIKGVLVPDFYKDFDVCDLEFIRRDSTSYSLILRNVSNMLSFIGSLGGSINKSLYDDCFRELYYINEAFRNSSSSDKDVLRDDFVCVIDDLNYLIGTDFARVFKNIIGKDEVSLIDVVDYFRGDLPIYYLGNSVSLKK